MQNLVSCNFTEVINQVTVALKLSLLVRLLSCIETDILEMSKMAAVVKMFFENFRASSSPI